MNKKRTIKSIALLMAAVICLTAFACVLAGCGEEQQSVYVVTMFGGTDAHAQPFAKMNKDYEDATGVVVENNSSGSNATWQTNVRNSFLLGQTTPDVLFYFSGSAADSIREHLVPLDTIIAEYPEYGKDIAEDVFKQMSDEHCLPFKGFTEGIIYNTDIYSKEDFSDYASLKNKIVQLKDDDKKRVSAGNDIPHYWVNYLMALRLGAEEFAAFDGTKSFFESPGRLQKWETAISWTVNELREMGIAIGGRAEANESERFFDGDRGLLVDGSWAANKVTISSVNEKLDITGFPLIDSANDTPFCLSGFTSGWYITKKAWNSDRRDAAVKYVMHHTTESAIDYYCREAGGAPATRKHITDASEAVSKFADLISSDDIYILKPIDDRMPDVAKTLFYSLLDGIPKLLSVESLSDTAVTNFFTSFYNLLI